MSGEKVQMSGTEFLRSIVTGRRHFHGIVLDEGTDLDSSPHYNEAIGFLKGKYSTGPRGPYLCISDSSIRGLSAEGLYLPRVQMKDVDMTGANVPRANFSFGYLGGVQAEQSNFSDGDFASTDFRRGNLCGVTWTGSNVWRADFAEADMRGAADLGSTEGLADAHFYKTVVDQREREILRKSLERHPFFVADRTVNTV